METTSDKTRADGGHQQGGVQFAPGNHSGRKFSTEVIDELEAMELVLATYKSDDKSMQVRRLREWFEADKAGFMGWLRKLRLDREKLAAWKGGSSSEVEPQRAAVEDFGHD